jgi:hypothetical protein
LRITADRTSPQHEGRPAWVFGRIAFPALSLRNRPELVALSIMAKVLGDYSLSLGLTSLMKPLGEALKEI